MTFRTSNYGAARGILGLIEVLLWLGILGGAIIAFGAVELASRSFGASSIAAALPGILVSVLCFIGVVLTQMGKAQVDTADYTYQMLDVARKQLKVSEQALTQNKETPQSFAQRAARLRDDEASPSATSAVSFSDKNSGPSQMDAGPSRDPDGARSITVGRHTIVHREGRFFVGAKGFSSEQTARQYIENLSMNPSAAVTMAKTSA